MNIVVVATTHPLPPRDGMQLHLFHLLRQLRGRHHVTLVSSPEPDHDTSAAALAEICDVYVEAEPVSRRRRDNRLLRELVTLRSGRSKVVDRLLASGVPEAAVRVAAQTEPDVVHLETGACAVFADRVAQPTVLVPLDASDLNAAADLQYAGGRINRWLAAREARRWKRFEQTGYVACDAVVVVGEEDARMLRTADSRLEPWVIPNGVDTDHFTAPDRPRSGATVVLHGAMNYAPNIDAARFAATEIMPIVRRHRPDAMLALVGRDPDPRVRSLADAQTMVTGSVPDVRPYLQQAAVYLCPMRTGSGIKNKLLEALACACPTVATPLATNGVDVEPGTNLLVAGDAASLAEAVVRLLDEPTVATSMGQAARSLAVRMSWAATADAFDQVYRHVA